MEGGEHARPGCLRRVGDPRGIRREALCAALGDPTPADGAALTRQPRDLRRLRLAARTREFRRAGGRFLVWDEDAREGAGWAVELAAVEPEGRRRRAELLRPPSSPAPSVAPSWITGRATSSERGRAGLRRRPVPGHEKTGERRSITRSRAARSLPCSSRVASAASRSQIGPRAADERSRRRCWSRPATSSAAPSRPPSGTSRRGRANPSRFRR